MPVLAAGRGTRPADLTTAAEFEAFYAARCGVTIEWLHQRGRYAEPCHCGEQGCEGWAMGRQQEDAIVEDQLRSRGR